VHLDAAVLADLIELRLIARLQPDLETLPREIRRGGETAMPGAEDCNGADHVL